MDNTQNVAAAINTANDALYHLNNADEMLSHAQNWGIVDLIGGGKRIAGSARHAEYRFKNERLPWFCRLFF